MFNGECKLATIWLYSKDPEKTGQFYRDVLEMKQIEHGVTHSFDGGGLRLSLHPLPEEARQSPTGECFLVFYLREGIEEKRDALAKKGVRVSEIDHQPYGETVDFKDPDGHSLFLWQPPTRDSKDFKHAKGLVEHYEGILSKFEAGN